MVYKLAVVRTHVTKYEALSSKVEAQNVQLEKLKQEVTELPGLREKLAKCKKLSERLALAEIWRTRTEEHLDTTGPKMDHAADQALMLCNQVAKMLKTDNKLVVENDKFAKMVLDDMERFHRILDQTKVYKLQYERKSWIARKWMGYDEALKFMTDLSTEMMNSGALVELEKFKLAVGKMGWTSKSYQSWLSQVLTRPCSI